MTPSRVLAVLALMATLVTVLATPAFGAQRAQSASAQQLADALAGALQSSNYQRLEELVSPNGWIGAFYQGEGTQRLSPQEAIEFMRSRQNAPTFQASVQTRPLFAREAYHPPGDVYIRSSWRNWGRDTLQNVDLLLRQEGSTWYWSGALFRSPNAMTATSSPTASPTTSPRAPIPPRSTESSVTSPATLPSTAATSHAPESNSAYALALLGLALSAGVIVFITRRRPRSS